MKSKVFYSLNEADVQEVATQEIGRRLSENEILLVQEGAVARLNWYDAIAQAIVTAAIE